LGDVVERTRIVIWINGIEKKGSVNSRLGPLEASGNR